VSWVELVVSACLFAGVAVFVYEPHVEHGGFYLDDWSHASDYRDHGWLWISVHLWHHVLPGRPALAALLPLPDALFGTNAKGHLAMAIALGVATSVCFYAFLRALSIEPIHAAAIALLSLLFPWSEAARLWPTASINNLAVCAYLLGSVVALRGLRSHGGRAILTHGGALVLYLLSLLIYEVAACAIALSVILYRTRASLRDATTRGLADVLLVVSVLGVSAVFTSRVRHVGSPTERIADVPAFSRQGLSILAASFLPQDVPSVAAKGLVLLLIAAVLGCALVLSREPRREYLRRWLRICAVAALGIGSAYLMFLGSTLYPSSPGLDTRFHVFGGLAFAASCYAILVISVEVLPLRTRGAFAIATAAGLVLALGFAHRLRDDIGRWDSGARAQRQFLSALKRTAPASPGGSTIFSFGYPGEAAPGIPIFTHFWDLNGAVRLTFDDPSLFGLPVYGRDRVVCEKAFVYLTSAGLEHSASYGRAIFADVMDSREVTVRSQTACQSARRMFSPGPYVASF
jgi:hypothetical protein